MIKKELSAKIEPFDSFWEAPDDINKGFASFAKFYKRNYLGYFPEDKEVKILIISCGAGYLLNLLNMEGYHNVLGIDSDPKKVSIGEHKRLNCKVGSAFEFLESNDDKFDLIFAEQEVNHLTKNEMLDFLKLCKGKLKDRGTIFVHSLNGANPITGSEALAQNFDHFNTLTEYSLTQVLAAAGFKDIIVFPLNLYVFYENPLNYIGILMNYILNLVFRLGFIFYGKKNNIFTKKIGAVAKK